MKRRRKQSSVQCKPGFIVLCLMPDDFTGSCQEESVLPLDGNYYITRQISHTECNAIIVYKMILVMNLQDSLCCS